MPNHDPRTPGHSRNTRANCNLHRETEPSNIPKDLYKESEAMLGPMNKINNQLAALEREEATESELEDIMEPNSTGHHEDMDVTQQSAGPDLDTTPDSPAYVSGEDLEDDYHEDAIEGFAVFPLDPVLSTPDAKESVRLLLTLVVEKVAPCIDVILKGTRVILSKPERLRPFDPRSPQKPPEPESQSLPPLLEVIRSTKADPRPVRVSEQTVKKPRCDEPPPSDTVRVRVLTYEGDSEMIYSIPRPSPGVLAPEAIKEFLAPMGRVISDMLVWNLNAAVYLD